MWYSCDFKISVLLQAKDELEVVDKATTKLKKIKLPKNIMIDTEMCMCVVSENTGLEMKMEN